MMQQGSKTVRQDAQHIQGAPRHNGEHTLHHQDHRDPNPLGKSCLFFVLDVLKLSLGVEGKRRGKSQGKIKQPERSVRL